MTVFLIILFAIIFIIVCLVKNKTTVVHYLQRNCQGIYWRRKYPDVPKEEIRKFLELFTESFCFNKKCLSKFKPDDKIMDIYKSLYPKSSWSIDSMELEFLADSCESEYKIDPYSKKIWHENLTLGELFEAAIKRQHKEKSRCC